MSEKRYLTASAVDENGNFWILGGTAPDSRNESLNSVTTEVYEYRPDGQGQWTFGYELPSVLRDVGTQSQCVVRINSTHFFMAGGFADVYKNCDTLEDQSSSETDSRNPRTGDSRNPGDIVCNPRDRIDISGGGVQLANAWMFDGESWKGLAKMSISRDRPACTLFLDEKDSVSTSFL